MKFEDQNKKYSLEFSFSQRINANSCGKNKNNLKDCGERERGSGMICECLEIIN